ncbi:hypothetical protein BLA29_014137, partial [Euroglyphus maynei]
MFMKPICLLIIMIMQQHYPIIHSSVRYYRKQNGKNYSYQDYSHQFSCDGMLSMKLFIDKTLSMAVVGDTLYVYQIDHHIGKYPGISWRYSPFINGVYLMD